MVVVGGVGGGVVLRVTSERIRARVVKALFQVHRLANKRCGQRDRKGEEVR